MSATTKNKYKATFILDLRESEDDSVKVMADLNETLKSIGGEPSDSEDLGMLDFARAADRRVRARAHRRDHAHHIARRCGGGRTAQTSCSSYRAPRPCVRVASTKETGGTRASSSARRRASTASRCRIIASTCRAAPLRSTSRRHHPSALE